MLISIASNLSVAEKKQIVALRQAYSALFDRLKTGDVSTDILQKLTALVDCLLNRNFNGANAIQTVSGIPQLLLCIFDNFVFTVGFGQHSLGQAQRLGERHQGVDSIGNEEIITCVKIGWIGVIIVIVIKSHYLLYFPIMRVVQSSLLGISWLDRSLGLNLHHPIWQRRTTYRITRSRLRNLQFVSMSFFGHLSSHDLRSRISESNYSSNHQRQIPLISQI